MNESSPNPGATEADVKRLSGIVSAAVDGVVSQQQQREIAELLEASPRLRQEYVRIVANEALLEEQLAKPLLERMDLDRAGATASASPEEPASNQARAPASKSGQRQNSSDLHTDAKSTEMRQSGSAPSEGLRPTSPARRSHDHPPSKWFSRRWSMRKIAWTSAAALLVTVVCIWGTRSSGVGEILVLEDVQWANDSRLEVGDDVTGRWIEIESGLVRLALADAQIALYGPTRFRASGIQHNDLSHGTLTARVGPETVGLVIQTPTTTVTDLSTSFGIAVEDDLTWVHVTEGRVRVKAHDESESVIGSAGDVIKHQTEQGKTASLEHYDGRMLQPVISSQWRFLGQHPVGLDRNEFDQDQTAFLFLESSNRILASDLQVNLQGAGRYRKFSRLGGVISAGTPRQLLSTALRSGARRAHGSRAGRLRE